MKIILSPSKRQNHSINYLKPQLLNYDKTIKIFKILKQSSNTNLKRIFKIKDNLLDEVSSLYQNFTETNPTLKAIECYSGVVFEQINYQIFNESQTNYLNSNLIILSAMYGALRPNTYIWPYRLDFTVKLDNINLYKYWQEDINDFFKDEDQIINLASNEFSKLLSKYQDRIINVNFLEEQKDQSLKVISYNAKKARGIMANHLIKDQVKDIQEIKKYNVDGYCFNQELSNDQEYYFIKKYHK